MIRAIRPSAMAQDDAAMVSGWNISPNVAYVLRLLPGASSCGVLLYSVDNVLIATGAALVGTEQPCALLPQTGQAIGMIDADLGWHLLITTTGTESQREIRIGPAVDLPDEIHPVYGDDDMALARATAAIDAAAHYIDDVTVTCPLGLGAGLGDVVSVPVDGVAVVGQVESITWTATPDGASEQAVIRRHVSIAPEAFVEPVPITPPTVADDTGATDAATTTSGNVLTNDEAGLTVVAVNGLSASVGVAVAGSNGGTFTIAADGSWTFDPDGDFAALTGAETAETSVTYYASDGIAEAMAILTVAVTRTNAPPVAVADFGSTRSDSTTSGNVLVNDTDADGDALIVSRVSGSVANVGIAVAGSNGGIFTISANGAWTFDPDASFDSLSGAEMATTAINYHASDGFGESENTLTVTVTAVPVGITFIGGATGTGGMENFDVALPAETMPGDLVIVAITMASVAGDYNVGIISPSGYTEEAELFADDDRDTNLSVNWKIMGSSVDSSVTISGAPVSSRTVVAGVYVLRGVDQDAPMDVAPGTATGINATTVNPPPVTPVTPGAFVVIAGGAVSAASPALTAISTGYTNVVTLSHDIGTAATVAIASKPWISGTEDPASWGMSVSSVSDSWAAVTMAIRPS